MAPPHRYTYQENGCAPTTVVLRVCNLAGGGVGRIRRGVEVI